jgi:hypothetical protein
MLLYEHPLSSYAQKVKIALREKGLDFTVETPPALGSGKADGAFAAASPRNDGAARLASGAIRREYRDHRLEWMMKSGGVQIVLDGLARNNIRFTWPLG